MTTGVVSFDQQVFKTRFPEFNSLGAPQLTALFNEATLFLDNSLSSPVQQVEQRAQLLNLLTAHLAQLYLGTNTQGPSQLVGRIDSASEGSVSVSASFDGQPGSAAWYQQTKYGAQYWQLTAPLRSFRFRLGSQCQRW